MKPVISAIVAILFVTILSASPTFAATIRVDWSGAGDYLTIKEGIDASADGYLDLVVPGTYVENIDSELRYKAKAHEGITQRIEGILRGDGYEDYANTYFRYLEKIKQGVEEADAYWWVRLFHGHHAVTHKSFLDLDRSAGDLANEHFSYAQDYCFFGQPEDAMQSLGIALHMVMDLTVPHHAAIALTPSHDDYEALVNYLFELHQEIPEYFPWIEVEGGGIYTFGSEPAHYTSDTAFGWIDYAAHISINYYPWVKSSVSDPYFAPKVVIVAEDLVPLAQRLSAGFAKFFFKSMDDDGDGWIICDGDCDDSNPDVNPGATEGPEGDPTCSDGVDNDCDGAVDGEDPACTGWDMASIPAGEFVMGSDETDPGSWDDEYPEHVVYLSAYEIDLYEVTNSEFADFLNAYGSNISPEGYEMLDDDAPDRHIYWNGSSWYAEAGYDDHPVIVVTWYGANTYCEYNGKRLPTEAEWEKAARGGCEVGGVPGTCEDPADERTYPWGEGIDCDHANYDLCVRDTTPVGSYSLGVSPYGAYDMAGNVYEWVKDWHDSGYYDESPYQDPQGPGSGLYRVLRGGSWFVDIFFRQRVASRFYCDPDYSNSNDGFRCAR